MKTAFWWLSSLLILSSTAHAWGPQGHMMVAAIAWDGLTPAAKAEVTRLLKLNPDYDSWIDGVDAADVDQIAFITAATWPDYIKGADGYTNDGEHPTNANAADNIGYDDKLQHRYWHFFDTPFAADNTATHGPDAVSGLTQVRMFVRALQKSDDDSVKSYDLVWIEHIVGDLHQPLHATSRFDVDDPAGDNGANRVHLCSSEQAARSPTKCKAPLHAFWDGVPGAGQSAAAARGRAAKLSPADSTKAGDLEPADWIDESFKLAKSDVYMEPIELGDGPFVLTADYRANARKIASQQIALAGARLANVLNTALSLGQSAN